MKGQDKHRPTYYAWPMSFELVPDWALSVKANAIPLIRSRQQDGGGILWLGGVHGDEPEGVELSLRTRDWLCKNPQIKLSWNLIPCINPDGFVLQQRVNAQGIDLNRNYPSKDWAPTFKAPRYFPGDKSAQAPEIVAMVQLIAEVKPSLIVHCHSWHPTVVYSGEPAKKMAHEIGNIIGYQAQDNIGYPTPGSLGSYAWHDHKIPVICIEEQEGCPLNEIWPRCEKAVEHLFMNWSQHKE